MTKLDFILQLQEKLSHLPKEDVRERLTFYIEAIEDRMEEGLSEEEAVAAVGSAEEIAEQIIADISPDKSETNTKRRLKLWKIVLLVLGSPIWFSLLISAFAVVLSLYISLWAVIISLWAVFASVAGSAFGCIAGGACCAVSGNGYIGIALIAAGFICAGLSVFLFFGSKAATTKTVRFTKNCFRRVWQ